MGEEEGRCLGADLHVGCHLFDVKQQMLFILNMLCSSLILHINIMNKSYAKIYFKNLGFISFVCLFLKQNQLLQMTEIYLIATSVFKCYVCNVCRNKDFFQGIRPWPRERGEREVPADTA